MWSIGLLLAAVRIPFYVTGHIQEDAYIAFRTAANLARTGVYCYNAGERVSACTSHAHVLVLALLNRLSPEYFMGISLLLNTAALVLACYLFATLVSPSREGVIRLWVCASLAPVPMLASYAGMELSFVLLLTAVAAWGIVHDRRALGAAAIFLLPWMRPDAVLAACILLAFAAWRGRRVPWLLAACLAAGVGSFGVFNVAYFGSLLNQSIVAKQVAFHPEHSPKLFLQGIAIVAGRILLPFYSNFLLRVSWIFAVVEFPFIAWLVWRARDRSIPLTMAALVFLPAPAYSAGGILFPWYLWPSQVVLSILLLAAVLESRKLRIPVGVVLCAGLAIQWAWSYSIGNQESQYRAGVGRYVNRISAASDSIMLEPIGYIPYYARRYTHDAIGLASPKVTQYRRQFGNDWWIRYVRDFRPTYYIERAHLRTGITLDRYQLPPSDFAWFQEHYETVKSFHYRPEDFIASPIGVKLARFWKHDDYDIYRLRKP